jgi:large subunit ribosomal protein L24
MPRHIRKGDLVRVICGNDSKRPNPVGKVLEVLPGGRKAIVQGINVRRKSVKPSQANQQGGVIDKEMPIDISNILPVVDGEATRVRFEIDKNGAKKRVAVKDGSQIGSELKKAK